MTILVTLLGATLVARLLGNSKCLLCEMAASASASSDRAGSEPTRPPPLRGMDSRDSFTFESIAIRLPKIVNDLADRLEGGSDPVPASAIVGIRKLASSIAADEPLRPLLAAQNSRWQAWLEKAIVLEQTTAADTALIASTVANPNKDSPDALRRCSWLSMPWWFVENYCYRAVLEITIPACGPGFDPFALHKAEATSSGLATLAGEIDALWACGSE